MQDRRQVARELERVAVGRDHECAAAPFLLLAHGRSQKVVGLVPGRLGRGEAERAHELGQQVELLEQIVVELATRLIAGEELVPVGRRVERVPPDEHGARLLRLPEPEHEVREAEQRVAGAAFRASKALRQRVVGAVRERVAVDDEQRTGLGR